MNDIDVAKNELKKRSQGGGYFSAVCLVVLNYIENLEKSIEEKQRHLENLQKVNEELEERIAIMSEADNDWHFFNFRPMTDEEKVFFDLADYEGEDAQMLENCPPDGEEVILWTPWGMSIDTYHWDIDGAYFDEHEEIEKGWAWKYLPKQPEPPKEGDE